MSLCVHTYFYVCISACTLHLRNAHIYIYIQVICMCMYIWLWNSMPICRLAHNLCPFYGYDSFLSSNMKYLTLARHSRSKKAISSSNSPVRSDVISHNLHLITSESWSREFRCLVTSWRRTDNITAALNAWCVGQVVRFGISQTVRFASRGSSLMCSAR